MKKMACTLLRIPLEARGYEVDEAEDGNDALRKIAKRQPDVILLDLMMPQVGRPPGKSAGY